MNKEEQLKENVIKCCIEGKMTVKQASKRLGLSEGHIKKLKARYKKLGPSSMLHGNCGRQPKHTLDIQLRQKILEIRKLPEYDTVNVSHFKDLLEELYGIKISYSALYRLLKDNNIKSPRKHRKAKQHHRRNRRTTMGELIQVMLLLMLSFKEIMKVIHSMDLWMMQLVILWDYTCVKMNVCRDILR